MVGLYHKRRAEQAQNKNKVLNLVLKYCMIFTLIGATLFGGIVVFFTGNHIKDPLSSYLSHKLNLKVSIDSVDFSPLYPGTIKLTNLSFGKSHLGELYIEYDLLKALKGDEFEIYDLYINRLNLDLTDLDTLKKAPLGINFGYQKVFAHNLRLNQIPLATKAIRTKDATLRLTNASFTPQDGISYTKGYVSTGDGSLYNHPMKNLSISFIANEHGLNIEDFNLATSGGNISGSGKYELINEKGQLISSKCINKNIENIEKAIHNSAALQKHNVLNHTYPNEDSSITCNQQKVIRRFDFDKLYVSNLIIREPLPAFKNFQIKAQNVKLSEVLYSRLDNSVIQRSKNPNLNHNYQPDYSYVLMQGISGSLKNFYYDENGFLGNYYGSIDVIAFPYLQTTFERNYIQASFCPQALNFNSQGTLYEGKYNAKGFLSFAENKFLFDEITLNHTKLGITKERHDFIHQGLTNNEVSIKKLNLNQIEVLSYLQDLPLSIQSLSVKGKNLNLLPLNKINPTSSPLNYLKRITPIDSNNTIDNALKKYACNLNLIKLEDQQNNTPDNHPSDQDIELDINTIDPTIYVKFKNLLYSNLLISKGEIKSNIEYTDLLNPIFNFNTKTLHFKDSSLNVAASLNLNPQPDRDNAHLSIQAQNFESADLNSNLINNMLTGKFDLHIELNSKNDTLDLNAIKRNLNGFMNFKADNLLIADFGLDLINGGKKQDFTLNGTELMTALRGSVAGISNANFNSIIQDGIIKSIGSMQLTTANMTLEHEVNLQNNMSKGVMNFVSLIKDSETKVEINNDFKSPIFKISAITRGANRPGLYLPQYEASAIEKEISNTNLNDFYYEDVKRLKASNDNDNGKANSKSNKLDKGRELLDKMSESKETNNTIMSSSVEFQYPSNNINPKTQEEELDDNEADLAAEAAQEKLRYKKNDTQINLLKDAMIDSIIKREKNKEHNTIEEGEDIF